MGAGERADPPVGLETNCSDSVNRSNYFMCLLTSLVISNMLT